MHCLSCYEPFFEEISWRYVFSIEEEPSTICEQCMGKLQLITGETCEKCGRSFVLLEQKYRKDNLCNDCIRWQNNSNALDKNRSLYVYNDFLQEIVAKWKYRGDAELAKIFWRRLKKLASQFEVDFVVPIPLSKQRLYERGFNQAKLLCEGLSYEIKEVLERPHQAEKQSKKSRKERLNREARFQIVPSYLFDLQDKSVLVVDDIYTTGATLYSAAQVLKENGAAHVFSISIARG